MTPSLTFWLGMLCGAVSLTAAYHFGRSTYILLFGSRSRGIPRYEAPPIPPKPERWYPLKVSELKEGEIYRCRLSLNRVRVNRCRMNLKKHPMLLDFAEGVMYVPSNGKIVECQYRDGQLETDDIQLAPNRLDHLLRALK